MLDKAGLLKAHLARPFDLLLQLLLRLLAVGSDVAMTWVMVSLIVAHSGHVAGSTWPTTLSHSCHSFLLR